VVFIEPQKGGGAWRPTKTIHNQGDEMAEVTVAELRHARLMGNTNFRGFDLSGLDLSKVGWLEGCSLLYVNLEGADLSGADLRRTRLLEANLSDVNLEGADLSGASLSGSNLRGAVHDAHTRWPDGFNVSREVTVL
jgi:hypothetical protein